MPIKINQLRSWILVAFAMSVLTACRTTNQTPVRVACVGDSITFGHRVPDPERNSYPAQLSAMLGDKWQVRNFGVNGATCLKKGTKPYNEQPAFRDVLSFKPNVIVI